MHEMRLLGSEMGLRPPRLYPVRHKRGTLLSGVSEDSGLDSSSTAITD